MTIRNKLILSNIAMIVIPVLLAALTASIFFRAVVHTGSGDPSPDAHFGPPAANDGGWTEGFLFAVGSQPGLLADDRFLSAADERLRQMNKALAVESGGSLTHVSPAIAAGSEGLAQQLEQAAGADRDDRGPPWADGPTLRLNGTTYAVEREQIAAPDANEPAWNVYLLTDRGPTLRFFRTFVPALFLSLLLGIAVTNGLLSYFVSRSIVRPLQSLKRAAERIKEGDLDHALEARKDEIGQAIGAFEEMRLRLRSSLAMQLQYEENRKELLSNISHDLRTPIAAISGCVEGLQTGIADSEEKRQRYVEMIGRKVAGMSRMIEELFLFSKLDLQREPLDLETLELSAYLRDLVAEWRHDPRMAGVELKLELAEAGGDPVYVRADREKLGRALANVMDNSVKHMDKDEKRLTLELRADGGRTAAITVRDNGRGIGERELPHIFERFYRADPSRSADSGGSGLGLAIVRRILEAHGGTAEAESEEGVGTAIKLTLPLAASKEEKGAGADEGADSDH